MTPGLAEYGFLHSHTRQGGIMPMESLTEPEKYQQPSQPLSKPNPHRTTSSRYSTGSGRPSRSSAPPQVSPEVDQFLGILARIAMRVAGTRPAASVEYMTMEE